MSNKLRSFIVVLVSIVVVMAALPLQTLKVNADTFTLTVETNDENKGTVWIGGGYAGNPTSLDFEGNQTNIQIIAQPKEGYSFIRWVIDDASQSAFISSNQVTTHVNMENNSHTVKAIFGTACDFTAIPDVEGAGTIDFSGDLQDDKSYVGGKVTLEAKPNNGYKFVGWKTSESDLTYVSTDSSYDVTVTGNSNYIACFAANTHTISFDINVPEGSTTSGVMEDEVVEEGSYTIKKNQFTYSGHYFTGWKIDGDNTLYEDQGSITVGESDITLYAQWEEGWTVSFNANGADSGTMQSVNISASGSTDYTIPDCSFIKDGYVFECWRADNPISGQEYKKDAILSVDKDTVLYAVWYRPVNLHANDGGDPENVKVQQFTVGDEENILSSTAFTKPEGKTFLGWATEANSTTLVYADGASITMTGDKDKDLTDLYALWGTPVTIKFDPNSAAGTMSDISSGVGLTMELPTVGYSLTGHSFKEWEVVDNPEGVTVSGDASTGYSISITNAFSGNSITLKAIWSPIAYDVCFKNDDGTVLQNSPVAYGSTPSCAAPTKADTTEHSYEFKGWSDGTETIEGTLPPVTGPVTYTATFTQSNRQYSVTASVSPSGTGSIVTVGGSDRYSETAALTVSPAAGYHVVGWKNNGNDAETAATAYDFEVKGNHTVVVYLEKDPHTVNVSSSGGGEVVYNGPDDLVYGDVVKVVATPSEGYQFVRWVDLDDNEVSTDAVYEFTVTADYSYKAVFALKQHDISVSAGAHGSVTGGGPYKHFESCEVVATPDKGYHFAGWEEDGSIVSENPNYSFSVTGNRKLEAVFEINMYTVTFKNDDGTVLQESEMPFGSTASYQHMANPTKKPTVQFTYTFAGWDNDTTLVTKDLTFTAVYTSTVNKYKITFTNEDGTVLQTSEVEYGKFPVYEKETPTKSATVDETFTFAGWDKEISKVTGETVYKATYTSKPITKDSINYKYFTVSFVSNGGSEVVSQLVAEGGVAFKPEEPLRERYTFGGWYIDADLTKPFSFATVITADTTLYAKWIKGSPEIEATYAVVGMGSITADLTSGEDITVEIERSKDNDTIGSHFKGVLIDGVEVDYYNYELAEDNSSVIIRSDALEGLDAGEHTITIVYDDGTAEVELIVANGNEPVKTTEEAVETEAGNEAPVEEPTVKPNNTALWIALAAVAGLVVIAIPIFIVIKRRGVK